MAIYNNQQSSGWVESWVPSAPTRSSIWLHWTDRPVQRLQISREPF